MSPPQPSHQIKRHDAARALGLGLGCGLGIPIAFIKEISGLLVPAIRQPLPRRPVVLGFFLSLHALSLPWCCWSCAGLRNLGALSFPVSLLLPPFLFLGHLSSYLLLHNSPVFSPRLTAPLSPFFFVTLYLGILLLERFLFWRSRSTYYRRSSG